MNAQQRAKSPGRGGQTAGVPEPWAARDVRGVDANDVTAAGVFRSDRSLTLRQRICEAVDSAEEVVVAASFLFADPELEGAFTRAAERGVRVYLLLPTAARLDREVREDGEDRAILDQHKALLQKLAGRVLVRSADSFHAKAVLVDPARPGPAFLLTANLTIDALRRNEELGIELTHDEARAAFAFLRWAAWEAADHELLEPGPLRRTAPLGVVAPPTAASGIFATRRGLRSLRDEATRIIDAAAKEIVVASYGWSAEHAVVLQLCARAKQGLNVTILARDRPKAMPALEALRQAGARVYGFSWLHAKAIWTDRDEALIMSANFEPDGLDEGFELGVTVGGARAAEVARRLGTWVAAAPKELRAADVREREAPASRRR